MKIWLDGKLVEQEEAKTSVFDHGTLYGDGIFEGIRFYNKRVFRLEDHMDRLYNCAHYLCWIFPIPGRNSPTRAKRRLPA
ncbi:MAG: aminotransferase class IV [Akkermansia sp.]